MLTLAEVALVKAKIAELERARDRCTDSGIRETIEIWTEEQRNKLASKATCETGAKIRNSSARWVYRRSQSVAKGSKRSIA